VEASIVVGKLLEQKSNTFGIHARNEKYVDLVETGIVEGNIGPITYSPHRRSGSRNRRSRASRRCHT